MIRKKKQIKTKRNPSPQFYNELKNLIGKQITVRFRNNTGFFSITGVLEQIGSMYLIYIHEKKMEAQIEFKLKNIEEIIKTSSGVFIGLYPSFYHNYGISFTLDDILEYIKHNTYVDIAINTKLYAEKGLSYPIIKNGKLKYNKKDKLFYLQSTTYKLQVSFSLEGVVEIFDGLIEIEI